MIKYIHMTCALLSFTGFFLRGILGFFKLEVLQIKWVKIVPHIVDTILLISAIAMLYTMSLSIIENHWLIAKIVALVLYIALGVIALRTSVPIKVRVITWLSALLVFVYIVSVAVTKSVWGFFS